VEQHVVAEEQLVEEDVVLTHSHGMLDKSAASGTMTLWWKEEQTLENHLRSRDATT